MEKESGKASLEQEAKKVSLEKEKGRKKKTPYPFPFSHVDQGWEEEGATSAPSRPSKRLAKGQEAPALAKRVVRRSNPLQKGQVRHNPLKKGMVMHQQPLAKGKKSQPLEKGLCQSRQHHHLHLAKGGRWWWTGTTL